VLGVPPQKIKEASASFLFPLPQVACYWEIAPTGHDETQLPHSMQASALTFAFPPSMTMASTGQVPTHASQETQVLSATTAFAMKKIPFLIYWILPYSSRREKTYSRSYYIMTQLLHIIPICNQGSKSS
jgi:hypothetical protein